MNDGRCVGCRTLEPPKAPVSTRLFICVTALHNSSSPPWSCCTGPLRPPPLSCFCPLLFPLPPPRQDKWQLRSAKTATAATTFRWPWEPALQAPAVIVWRRGTGERRNNAAEDFPNSLCVRVGRRAHSNTRNTLWVT